MTGRRSVSVAKLFSAGGGFGQIVALKTPAGCEVRHYYNEGRIASDLKLVSSEEAGEIAKYDDNVLYRPLKTAPNLRHGWRIHCRDEDELRRVIGQIYPGRIAALDAHLRGDLKRTALRETLDRQSGMYKAAARISDDEVDDLVARVCRSDGGCLRTILWKRDRSDATPSSKLPATKFDPTFDQTGKGRHVAPLVCQEACNLLVSAARETVKLREGEK